MKCKKTKSISSLFQKINNKKYNHLLILEHQSSKRIILISLLKNQSIRKIVKEPTITLNPLNKTLNSKKNMQVFSIR